MTSKQLQKGQLAPHFSATVWDNGTIDLFDNHHKKTWLAFFRYAACPLCNLRVHHIIERHSEFEKLNLRIIAVFQSPASSIAQYVGQQKPPFPLICDPDERLYDLYHVKTSWLGFLNPSNLSLLRQAKREGFGLGKMEGRIDRLPADFLIDENRVIHTAFYAEKAGDHIPFEVVFNFARQSSVQDEVSKTILRKDTL